MKLATLLIRHDGTVVALDAEYLVRHLHLHVLFDRNLAGQAVVVRRVALVDQRQFGRQDRPASREHLHPALSTGAAAATSRRHEQVGVGKSLHELGAYRNAERHFVINHDR